MKKLLLLFGFLIVFYGVVGGWDKAQAQTLLQVPFSSGKFAWDAPSTGSQPTSYVVTCGSNTFSVTAPATSVNISAVVPGPGTYNCTLYARNAFGKSPSPDPAFPQFEAGNPPGPAVNLRIEVTNE